MTTPEPNRSAEEQKLVKLYMELTGKPETAARCVFMYLRSEWDEAEPPAGQAGSEPEAEQGPAGRPGPGSALAVLLTWVCLGLAAARAAGPPPAQTSSTLITSPLSLADAVNLALHQNPAIVRAQKTVEAADGVAIQTRAIALPTLNVGGSYSAAAESDVDTFQTPPVPGMPQTTFGTPQNWVSQIKLVQSIYQGGRLLSSFRVADLTRQQAMLNFQATVADSVLLVQLAYYDVLLAAQQIIVQEASVELLSRELADATRRFDAGTVPRFNVLRAEVELANARPKLIVARNSLRVAKNNLAVLLGFNLPHEDVDEIPLTLSGRLDADPYEIDLEHAMRLGLERRPELAALRKAEALRKEDIIAAKSGYKPALQAYAGYDAHNSILSTDLTDEKHGWIVGAQLSWNLFDGLRTQGRIKEATANYERAEVEVDDSARRIELEVRTSYSNFIEAREVLESQKKVVEQGEETLRLARARNEAGTGTQLDVLSAQNALTDARSTQVQALHDYDAARARLHRAVGMNVPQASTTER
jgi:outer membrane protein TolC